MSKQTKSVRMDEEVVALIDDFCCFMNQTFKTNITFSKIAPEAFAFYIYERMDRMVDMMKDQSIVYTTPTGRQKHYSFTEEQIYDAQVLAQRALAEYTSYDEK